LDEYRGITSFSPEGLDAWAEEYIRRRDYLLNRGIKLLFVIVPNKHTIYPEHLPPWHFKTGPTKTDQIVSELKARNVSGVVDLRTTLRERARKESIYGRYDTHWNYLGAYFAYQEIIKHIPGARQINFEELVFYRGRRRGDLSRLIGYPELADEALILDTDESNIAFEHNKVRGDMQYMEEGWISNTVSPDLPRALFLVDSFTDDILSAYLAPSFREALFKHHHRMQFDTEHIERFNPDYVVYIIVERSIPYRPYWRF
jgi:alginate O-acetyltransferase complex protein AlgJ